MNAYVNRAIGTLHAEVLALEAAKIAASLEETEEIEAAIGNLRSASAEIVRREAARSEDARKQKEWEAIVPECREASDKYKRLKTELEQSHVDIENAQSHADFCDGELNRAKNAPLPRYASAEEIAARATLCEKLADALTDARGKLREAVTTRDRISTEVLRAREEFGRIEFQERRLRPRTESRDLQVVSIG